MMQEHLKQFWQQRNPDERRTLRIGGIVLAIALLYAFVWYPLSQGQQRLRNTLPQVRAAAAQIQLQAQEVSRLRSLPPKAASNNLRSAVDAATARSSIGAPAEFLPLDAGRARIIFNNAIFDRWIEWVKFLQLEQSIRVETADITALTEPGMVKIQAVLAPSGTRP
jgi:general secretion pathway protein M